MCAISANTNPKVAAILLHEKLTQKRQEWTIISDHMHMSVSYTVGYGVERQIDGRACGQLEAEMMGGYNTDTLFEVFKY